MTTSTPVSRPTHAERRFIEYLEGLAAGERSRAALAALRRGLGRPPGEAVEMHRYVVKWLPRDAPQWQEDAYYLVASLFASHPMSWPSQPGEVGPTNLGASFARLLGNDGEESVERRFTAMLNCRGEDLHVHLRHAVSLLKSRDVAVDWARLLRDLQQWHWEDRPVQRTWARAFWGYRGPSDESEDASIRDDEPDKVETA